MHEDQVAESTFQEEQSKRTRKITFESNPLQESARSRPKLIISREPPLRVAQYSGFKGDTAAVLSLDAPQNHELKSLASRVTPHDYRRVGSQSCIGFCRA